MHSQQGRDKLSVIGAIGLLGAFCLWRPVAADPIRLQDAAPHTASVTNPVELILDTEALATEEMADQGKTSHSTSLSPAQRSSASERTTSQIRQTLPTAPAPQTSARVDLDVAAELRSSLKESIRPLHDQVMGFGALETWKDLKIDLGLSQAKEHDEGVNITHPRLSGQWEAFNSTPGRDPGSRPMTAAQAEVDREQAAHLLAKLIDEIKPWAFSLFGLYLLGYLIKTGYDHAQQRSIRRRERKTARAKRRLARKAQSIKTDL